MIEAEIKVTGGSTLWSVQTGEGDLPVILLNGGPGCGDYLAPVAEVISDIATVVRFEPRGCGRSSWDGRYDLATAIADIEAVRQHWNLTNPVLVGHSFGPDLGLAYLLANPSRVRGLVGLAGGRIVNDRQWHAIYEEGKDREENPGFHADPGVNPQLINDYRAWCHRAELLRDIADIACPVRYISAAKDIRPSWPAQQLASLIPDGSYAEIAGVDHYIWRSPAFGPLFRQVLGDAFG